MKPQLSQDYNVDSRYRGMGAAQDNSAGLNFVSQYIERRRAEAEPNVQSERREEDRFRFDGNTSFRNLFRPSK